MTGLECPRLPVLFRFTKEWGVCAYFPTLRERNLDVTCYAHIGQHSSAHPSFMREGKRATPEQCADLLRELRSIYERPEDPDRVTLVVYQRAPRHA